MISPPTLSCCRRPCHVITTDADGSITLDYRNYQSCPFHKLYRFDNACLFQPLEFLFNSPFESIRYSATLIEAWLS